VALFRLNNLSHFFQDIVQRNAQKTQINLVIGQYNKDKLI